ncbi:ion transporter [Pseudomonas sp. No.21]|uniref:ion transporter n=1 Tax=Pseudomonas tohonis TaxID=2725477 RepID=UPI001F3C6B17|nr:ion transporter [Pseudomonas tohonis]GJN48437.1 potassium channel [Pseudomonas tohonis]
MAEPHSRRERLYSIIFQADTPAGRRFDTWLIWLILASLAVVLLDSVEHIHRRHAGLLSGLEWAITALFIAEYLLRLYSAPKPLRYAFSFFGLVDLMAIIPGVVALLYPDAQYLLIVRALRLVRVFRIFKLRHYLVQANFLLSALRGSQQKIAVFLLSVSTLVVVFGALMYVIEGPENGFTSIPTSIYWAVVTLTTVGFGDITPKTALGQAVASLVMITGYSIIAVPTGIFSAELANAMRQEGQLDKECATCRKRGHESAASFYSRCGNPLFPRGGEHETT